MMYSTNKFFYALVFSIGMASGIGIIMLAKPSQEKTSNVKHACPSYKEFYDKSCTFCRIIAGLEPATILYENDLVIAFEKKPIRTPVSCLIVPKKHIKNFKEFNTQDACNLDILGHMIEAAQLLSKRLKGSGDFKLQINNGQNADQTVFHVHMHFISNDVWA